MLMPQPARSIPDKFQVAFSLAGEERDLVRAVAQAVEQELGTSNVFLDEWFEHYIAGDDADLMLQRIYSERCVLAVVCVSQRYGGKPWTKTEHAAIRARYMKARESQDERDRLSILPIRVGEGEVEGILFNTIVPDIRGKTPGEAAKLIIDRLRLIVPSHGGASGVPEWPEQPPAVSWPMADHSEARAAFGQLLTRTASFRLLPVCGPSETGKTHMTNQMLGNALRMPYLDCGRFDFKGTTDMDAEVHSFLQELRVPVPPASARLSERFVHILNALKQRARPTLLVFDTYEAAGEGRDWVEKQLLPSLIRATWLRVVIVGQRVPEPVGAMWEAVSAPVITLQPPPPNDWFLFGRQHKPEITLEFVRQAHQLCGGKASVLSGLVGPR
jgi:hypothetical protein